MTKPSPKKASKHDHQTLLRLKLLNSIFPGWTTEFKFHSVRRWRFEYAHEEKKIAVEIEGGAFSGGRHTRGTGFIKDMEKYNAAAKLGWRLFRYTPQQTAELMDDMKGL